jgi:hypothetical protein
MSDNQPLGITKLNVVVSRHFISELSFQAPNVKQTKTAGLSECSYDYNLQQNDAA